MDDSAINIEPGVTARVSRCPTVPVPALSGLRLWFAVFVVWMGLLATAAFVLFARYESGTTDVLGLWILVLMAFFLSLCNGLLPLPTAWIILLAASDSVALLDSAWLRVITVACVGATATMMANLNEYHILGYFLRDRLGQRLRRSRPYRWAIRWFNLAPFQTLLMISFVPIPVDFVRWLAILRNYSRPRYALAYWLGRVPRYALLAGLAVVLRLGWVEIVLLQAAIIVVLGARLAWSARRRPRRARQKMAPPASENV